VWSPGETLIIDWGSGDGLHVFCAVAAWRHFRFLRFATDETATTTFDMLASPVTILRRRCLLKGRVILPPAALLHDDAA
jgi:hypothetical protein